MLFSNKSINVYIPLRKLTYKHIRTWYARLALKPPPDPPYTHVIQIGDPLLRSVSEPVFIKDIATKEFKFILQRMRTVLKQYDCVGLSAVQIGMPLRVLIAEFSEKHARHCSPQEYIDKEMSILPQTIIVNPVLKITDYAKVVHSESCRSVTAYMADCARYRGVEINGYNEHGEKISLNTYGWVARIFQHEMDHLNGKLYTDIMHRNTFTCCCWQVINERSGKVEMPYGPY